MQNKNLNNNSYKNLNNNLPPQQRMWTGISILRLVVFILHATSAIFLAIVAGKCGASFMVDSFTETLNHGHPSGYRVVTAGTCDNSHSASCFYGIPAARDIAQKGLEWNVFALIAAFEWISASFALGHLTGNFDPEKRTKDDVSQVKFLSLIWNLAGVLSLLAPGHMSLLQAGITFLSLVMATSVQYYPIGGEDDAAIVMHYTEYCTSASLLYLGVLILYVPGPQSWAAIIGFTGILLCNLTGVSAHLCKIDTVEGRTQLPFFDLDWGKSANHFKLFLLHSWLGMVMAVLIIVYLARDSFTSDSVPWWVRLILINLLVTYTMFGVWATVCYGAADMYIKDKKIPKISKFSTFPMTPIGPDYQGEPEPLDPGFSLWVSYRLGFGLTILSAAAKLPIAFTVFYGLIAMPTEATCTIF